MVKLELVALRDRLDDVLAALQPLQAAEVITRAQDPAAPTTEGSGHGAGRADRLLMRLDRLLTWLPDSNSSGPVEAEPAEEHLEELVDELEPAVDRLLGKLEALRTEHESLPRYLAPLAELLPLLPELAGMDDRELANRHLATIALVLDDHQGQVVALLREQLDALLGRRYLLVTAVVGDGSVGCLLALSTRDLPAVEQVLGGDSVARVSVPADYAGRSLGSTVADMRDRMAALPSEEAAVGTELALLLAPHEDSLRSGRWLLAARRERELAAQHAELGERTFALRLWVPRPRLRALRAAVAARPYPVAVLDRPRRPDDSPPVLLRNPRPLRPYQRLVGFLSWPQSGGLDPTGLMGVVLPFLFGVMVGDVGYGLALMTLAWLLRRRMQARSPAVADIARVLLAGGAWSVLFGVLFGEFLGSLGNTLGMPALWFYRGGPAALEPLLLFALAIGAVHISLGVVIGLVSAIRHRSRHHVFERAGTLLFLAGLFVVAGIAASALPAGLVSPAVAAVVVGIVLVGWPQGALGVLLGPLETLSTIGNILSYLRLAAVGLASVYLANVANELAAAAPLLLGIIVGVFFHSMNLALAAFSPMVQSLRLHYVEFFSKFYEGGGQPFAPLGADLSGPTATRAAATPPADLPQVGSNAPEPREAVAMSPR